MPNDNCLENRQCPQCQQTDRFDVTATATFRLVDEGTEYHGDVEYGDDNAVACPDCGWAGKWKDTDTEKQAEPAEDVPKKRYWASWLQPTEDYRALTFPPNEAIIGYWCSGYASDKDDNSIPILCAVIDAQDEEAAAEAVLKDWPEWKEWRFIEERASDYRPGDRFPIESEWEQERFNKRDHG